MTSRMSSAFTKAPRWAVELAKQVRKHLRKTVDMGLWFERNVGEGVTGLSEEGWKCTQTPRLLKEEDLAWGSVGLEELKAKFAYFVNGAGGAHGVPRDPRGDHNGREREGPCDGD